MINQWVKNNPERAKIHGRRHVLKKYHNITLEDYDILLKKQKGQCGICQTTKPGSNFSTLAVDHNHKTNTIRGLLCYKCNVGIGMFNDDIIKLQAAVKYLENQHGSPRD